MSAFLFLLVKLNLAMGAVTILVSLLRRPLRLWFGAPIAYAIWFAVPSASMAILFPPRMGAPASITPVHMPAAVVSVMGPLAHSALRVTEQLTGQGALAAIATPPLASTTAIPELLLFAAWALGTLFMAVYLTRLQLRFSAAVRLGEAGPAVLGFLRPRIVTPDGFQQHFTPLEQAAILTHEHIHLARQDARINALAALLRCLCWFNPLIHLGARWLRVDQELACDATAVAGAISRRTYAKALLKSQLVVTALPLGCYWPGSQHPLIERIALLKRKPPGTARRLAGVSLVLLAATFAGLGAWAAQPPVAANPMAARQPGTALPAPSAGSVAAPGQTAGEPAANQPAADANAIRSGHPDYLPKDVSASKRIFTAAPADVPIPNSDGAEGRATFSIVNQSEMLPAAIPVPASIASDILAAPIKLDGLSEHKDNLALNVAEGAAGAQAATADAVAAVSANAQRLKSAALACLLGMSPDGCETLFEAAWQSHAFGSKTYCAQKYARWEDGCRSGPLESVAFLGIDAAGADIFDVSFQHTDMTYIVFSPAADGKIPAFVIFNGSHDAILSSLATITSPAYQLLYTRPQQQSSASWF